MFRGCLIIIVCVNLYGFSFVLCNFHVNCPSYSQRYESNTLEYYGTDPKIDPTIEYLLPEEIKGRERGSKDVFKLREAPFNTCYVLRIL